MSYNSKLSDSKQHAILFRPDDVDNNLDFEIKKLVFGSIVLFR